MKLQSFFLLSTVAASGLAAHIALARTTVDMPLMVALPPPLPPVIEAPGPGPAPSMPSPALPTPPSSQPGQPVSAGPPRPPIELPAPPPFVAAAASRPVSTVAQAPKRKPHRQASSHPASSPAATVVAQQAVAPKAASDISASMQQSDTSQPASGPSRVQLIACGALGALLIGALSACGMLLAANRRLRLNVATTASDSSDRKRG